MRDADEHGANSVDTVREVAVKLVPADAYCLALGCSMVEGHGVSGLPGSPTVVAEKLMKAGG